VFGAGVGLFLGELWVRVSGHDPIDDPLVAHRANSWTHECVDLDPELGYVLRPGACGANSLGILDDERPFRGAPEELRVAAFGDSVTADRMYTDFLEVILAKRLGRPVAVFNLGVTGWSTREEAAYAERRLDEIAPHALILQFTANDYLGTPVYARVAGEVRVLDGAARHGPVATWMLRHSAAWRVVSLRSGARRGVRESAPSLHAALARFATVARRGDVPAWALLVPELWDPGATPEPVAWAEGDFAQAAGAAGLDVVDLTRGFEAAGMASLRRNQASAALTALAQLPLDPSLREFVADASPAALMLRGGGDEEDHTHPNFHGHALAAEALAEVLGPALAARGAASDPHLP